tara:strand:- start:33475 stop:33675 length:201 start_codon:yes stop_codon:yes gene_type:complete
MPVDQCICHEISFAEIKKIAEEKGYTSIEEIQIAGISSTHCKMCEPYIRAMLKTGKTSFIPGFHLK